MTYTPRDHLDAAEEAVIARIPAAKQKALIKAFNAWFDAPPGDGTTDPIVAQFCAAAGIDGSDLEIAHGIRVYLFHFRDNRIFEPRRLLYALATLHAPAA